MSWPACTRALNNIKPAFTVLAKDPSAARGGEGKAQRKNTIGRLRETRQTGKKQKVKKNASGQTQEAIKERVQQRNTTLTIWQGQWERGGD